MSQSLRNPYLQPQVTHEVHERKHSVAVPALVVGALTAALVAGLLRDRPRAEVQADPVAYSAPEPTEDEGFRALAGVTLATAERAAEVRLSSEIQRACEIGSPDAWFGADSAALNQTEDSSLDEFATCLVGGPLAGRQVRVWGHADVVTNDQTPALGQRRAEAVVAFLRERGVRAEDVLPQPSLQRWAPGSVPKGIGSQRIIVAELLPAPGGQP